MGMLLTFVDGAGKELGESYYPEEAYRDALVAGWKTGETIFIGSEVSTWYDVVSMGREELANGGDIGHVRLREAIFN